MFFTRQYCTIRYEDLISLSVKKFYYYLWVNIVCYQCGSIGLIALITVKCFKITYICIIYTTNNIFIKSYLKLIMCIYFILEFLTILHLIKYIHYKKHPIWGFDFNATVVSSISMRGNWLMSYFCFGNEIKCCVGVRYSQRNFYYEYIIFKYF